MLSMLLLVFLSLCNAQLPQQDIEYDEDGSGPIPLDQPGYPYGEPTTWVENVPNQNFSDILYRKSHKSQKARPHRNPDHELPIIYNQNLRDILKNLIFPDNSEPSKGNESVKANDLKTKSPITSVISKFIGNVTLSRYNSVKDGVTNLVNKGSALRNDTDQLVDQLNLLYVNLAIDESDNVVRTENSYKYGMSVILRFLFEFYRIFRKMSFQSAPTQLQLTDVDVYDTSYNKAIAVMKSKKNYSPLEISAPLRRSADILKSIIYESVIIIQTKCKAIDPNWKCIIVYLANLITETFNCSHVWYHAFIHMMALEKIGIRDSFVYKIANLEKFKELAYFENIFDFVIEKIQEYREAGRVQLSVEAVFFTMLADLQENGFLDCISVDYLYN